jgi:type IV secretion system protein VirB6
MSIPKLLCKTLAIMIIVPILLFYVNASKADYLQQEIINNSANNSCVAMKAPANALAQMSPVSETMLLAFMASFSMTGKSCNPSTAVNFCWSQANSTNNSSQCYSLDSDKTLFLTTAGNVFKVRAITMGQNICLQVYIPNYGYFTVGCNMMASPNQATSGQAGSDQQCVANAINNSKSLFPFPGIIINCIQNGLFGIFNNQQYGIITLNIFTNFQNSLRNVIRAALILYVILFGFSLALNTELPEKKDIFMFIAKFILVIYFSVGFTSGTQADGSVQYTDGITQLIIPFFLGLSNQLSDIIIMAGGNQTLCQYNPSDYNPGYSFMSIWDKLSCRVFAYMGQSGSILVSAVQSGVLGSVINIVAPAIGLFLSCVMGGQILFGIMSLLFGVLLIALIVALVGYVSMALIGLTIVSFIGPIFVPFALFPITKQFCDKWVSALFGFALQPPIFIAFISLVLTVFDNLMYGTCTFETVTDNLSGRMVSFSDLNLNSSDQGCTSTYGYISTAIAQNFNGQYVTTIPLFGGLFSFNIVNALPNIIFSTSMSLIFLYLFYKFSDDLSRFCGQIVNSINLGDYAMMPSQLADQMKKLAIKAVKAYASKGKSLVQGDDGAIDAATKLRQK